MISETWLRKENLEEVKDHIINGNQLQIIHKYRPTRRDGTTVHGGGVAIVFDPNRIRLRQYALKKNNREVVAAYGRLYLLLIEGSL